MDEYIHITYDPKNSQIIFESDKFFYSRYHLEETEKTEAGLLLDPRQDKIKHQEYSLAIGLAYYKQKVEVEIWDKKRFPIKQGVFTKFIANFKRHKHHEYGYG